MFRFWDLQNTHICPTCDSIWIGVNPPEFCAECDTPGPDFEHAVELESRQFCPVVGVQ